MSDNPDSDARRCKPDKVVLGSHRNLGNHERQHNKQPEHTQGSDQAYFFSNNRKDEVCLCLWEESPLLPAGAEPHTPPTSGGKGVLAVKHLPASTVGVTSGVQPGGEACEPVRSRDRHQRDNGKNSPAQPCEQAHRCASNQQHRRHHRHHHQRRPEVTLHQDEEDQRARHGGERDHQGLPTGDTVAAGCQQVRDPHRQCQLAKFAGLKSEWPAQRNPVSLTIDLDSDTGDEYEKQHHKGQDHRR